MKIVLRLVAALALVLLLAAGVLVLCFDSLVASAITQGGTHATGTPTKVESVHAKLLEGGLTLQGFSVHNPAGFRDEPFVAFDSVRTTWENGTLLSDRIVIGEVVVEGLAVNLEKNDQGTNWGAILDHMERLAGPGAEPAAEEEPAGPAKAVHLKRIELRDLRAALHVSGVPLVSGSKEVHVPLVVIEDLRTDGSTTEIVAVITRAVLDAALEAVVKNGGGILPDDVLGDLGGDLKGLEKAAREQGRTILEDAQKAVEGIGDLFKKKP